jgi:hypothetical protein
LFSWIFKENIQKKYFKDCFSVYQKKLKVMFMLKVLKNIVLKKLCENVLKFLQTLLKRTMAGMSHHQGNHSFCYFFF